MNTGERRVGEAGVAMAEPPPEQAAEKKKSPVAEVQEELEKVRAIEDKAFMSRYEDVEKEQLIVSGYVTHEAEIMEGFKVTIRTLKEQEDLDVSQALMDVQGTQHFVAETISRHILARSVVAINGAPFGKSVDDRFEKIGDWAKAIKLSVYQELLELNKAVGIMIKGHSGNSLEPLLIGRG